MKPPRLLPLLALPLSTLGVTPCVPLIEPAPSVLVQVDPTAELVRVDGIGGSAADEGFLRSFPEPARSRVMDLVFGDLEPSLVRLKVRPAIEPANDDADPAHVNAAGFVSPDDLLWQLGEIFARSEPRLLAAMWTPPAWMKTTNRECCGGTLLAGMDPELAELFSVWLGYLEAAGHPLDWLSIQNEPEAASPWDANTYIPTRMGQVAEAVAARLVADGHATRLLAPDNAVAAFVEYYLPPILAQPTAASLLDAVAFHLYGGVDYTDPSGAALEAEVVASVSLPGLPVWMTEFSNTTGIGYGSYDEALWQAALVHHAFAGGASAYVMWNLYRPGGPGEALVVLDTAPGSDAYTVTPKYWSFRQYAKFVRPGALRVSAEAADPELLVDVFRDDAAGQLVAVLIHPGDEPRWAVFEGITPSGPPRVVRTTEAAPGSELPPDSEERFGALALRLPPRSVTTAIWPLD